MSSTWHYTIELRLEVALGLNRGRKQGTIQEVIDEPPKARFLRLLWQLSGRRPKLDQFLSSFLSYRKFLPECDAQDVIPRFSETEVRIKQSPLGTWSTPLADVFILLKAALGFESKRILELGSYRGDTARLLAENTGPDTVICAVDADERHGASYRGLPIESKIRRKTGRISPALFDPGEKFDLIFVDADHDYASVMNDTAVAFEILADPGIILWHDYNQEAYFHGLCGVAEALNETAKSRPICAIRGTWLAIFSNVPGWRTEELAQQNKTVPGKSVWDQRQVRG